MYEFIVGENTCTDRYLSSGSQGVLLPFKLAAILDGLGVLDFDFLGLALTSAGTPEIRCSGKHTCIYYPITIQIITHYKQLNHLPLLSLESRESLVSFSRFGLRVSGKDGASVFMGDF